MAKRIYDENSDISDIYFDDLFFYYSNILTEGFLEKYKDKFNHFDWKKISKFQKLSN